MDIKQYVKDKMPFLIIHLVIFLFVMILMIVSDVGSAVMMVVASIWFLPIYSYLTMEYIKHQKYLNECLEVLESLDQKYLLTEMIETPNFPEGMIFYDILKECNKAMHENVNDYKDSHLQYQEYIEMWVHEIKTPIASTRLILENNEQLLGGKINTQLNAVENYIDQVLYYARSQDVSKDYIVKQLDLKSIVSSVIRKNSSDFIQKKIALNIDQLSGCVYSDSKWIEFILNQIIGNSIKYAQSKDAKISIYSTPKDNQLCLCIEDNGVGVVEKDINRVFEKGFTGENGRLFGRSTGMGLYLCYKMCKKLGIGITFDSKVNVGTKVKLIFPIGSYSNFS